MLKAQDIVVALKLAVRHGAPWSYPVLSQELGISAAETHAAIRRGAHAGLIFPDRRRANRSALFEFLSHGVRYAFPAERGGITRGVPTAYAAPPLAGRFVSNDPPPVWPDPEGEVRGEAFFPLYRSVPRAARNDRQLYECLALVDAIRDGRARERNAALDELKRRLVP